MNFIRTIVRIVPKILLALVMAGLVIVLILYLDGSFSHKVPADASKPADRPANNIPLVDVRFISIPNIEQAPGTIQPLHETALASTLFTLFVIPVIYYLLYANKSGHGVPELRD